MDQEPTVAHGAPIDETQERATTQRWWLPVSQSTIREADTHPVVLRRDAIYRRVLAGFDVLAAALAVTVAAVGVGHRALAPTAVLLLPLVVLVAKLLGLYERDEHVLRKSTLDEAPALFQLATLFALLIWLADGVAVIGGITRFEILLMWALLFVTLLLARGAARRAVMRVVPVERCLLLGDHVAATRVERVFRDSPAVKAELVAELPLEVGRRRGELPPPLAPRLSLSDAVREHDVHRVIIAPTTSSAGETLDAVRLAKSLGVRVSVLPRLFEVIGSSAKWDHADGMTLLGVPSFGLSKSSRFLKRGLDLGASTLALLALGPLLALIAVAVKLTSRGPVLFRQARIGKDGQQFEMLKFRSMVDGADDVKPTVPSNGLFKLVDDPRVTPIGRVIRRLSLDELPQLYNVLRGEMSLVGPRPLIPKEDALARGWQRRRLNVVPGMTGLWQVLGSARIPFDDMVTLDYLYGANWSLWLDVKILLRTILFVFGRRGI
jgi:exopolysaccharide biosynthesis polyprenyl glycosylphosphotransferase